jgi:K+-transporting ATPase KdpF subunit
MKSRRQLDERHFLRRGQLVDFQRLDRGSVRVRTGLGMDFENVALLIVSAIVMAYLIFALLRPEKF